MEEIRKNARDRRFNVTLYKTQLHGDIDAVTDKRVEATPGPSQSPEENLRVRDTIKSDSTEDEDGYLIERWCDLWDARMRRRLSFCLVPDEEEKKASESGDTVVFDCTDAQDYDDAYRYRMAVDSGFTRNDARSVTTMMHDFIVRGALYDWYLRMGQQPTDTEQTLDALLDDIASRLRGRPWGRRPMQPFGPALFDYYKK